jgi:hypothetical protein
LALPDPSDACRRQALRDWLLIDLIEGRLQSPPWTLDPRDTSAAWQSYRALRLAATDDTLGARAALRGLRHRRLRWTARVNLLLAEGLIDLRAGRFQRVVDALDPPARTRAYEGRPPADITPYALRWVVSAAWAGLGRPDSAAALCALALHPAREASPLTSDWFEAYPITLPFALQRMVMLETRLGRLEDARRHMQTLDSLATRPDAEFRPLLAEARQALESAEAMGRGGTAEVRSR